MKAVACKLLPAVLLLLAPRAGLASFIALAPGGEIGVVTQGEAAVVAGRYAITNQGDEVARNVFATFQLGRCAFATERVSIEPDQAQEWSLDHSCALSDLACAGEEGDLCGGEELPLRGAFPLRITRHYEDVNGYPFSNVSVHRILVLDPGDAEPRETPTIEAEFHLDEGRHRDFSGFLELRNLTDIPRTVSVALVLPREVAGHTPASRVQLGPRSVEEIPIHLTTPWALDGSAYEVVAVLQWSTGTLRNMAAASHIVQVEQPSLAHYFFGVQAVAGAVALLLLALALVVLRRSRSGRP